jgi:hypothetical protein
MSIEFKVMSVCEFNFIIMDFAQNESCNIFVSKVSGMTFENSNCFNHSFQTLFLQKIVVSGSFGLCHPLLLQILFLLRIQEYQNLLHLTKSLIFIIGHKNRWQNRPFLFIILIDQKLFLTLGINFFV